MPPTRSFSVGSSTFLVAPEAGCRLMKWTLRSAMGTREILHWPQETGQTAFSQIRGGNPILFPFCGRSFVDGVEGYWIGPDQQKRPMPKHGFARQGEFEVVEIGPHHLVTAFIPDAEALEAYPFAYSFHVTYTFEELALSVTLSLENKNKHPIPWSAGHHFYFTLPWHVGTTRDDYLLHMEPRKSAYHGPDGLLVTTRERNARHALGDPALIDRIHWELRHHQVSFGPKNGEEDVFLTIGEKNPPAAAMCLVTWSESEDAPWYCVEPWMGPPNAAGHGKGLHWVAAGERADFTVRVSLY
jgi:galactose mutarotase-like enzyme